jgi:hypothetical protein
MPTTIWSGFDTLRSNLEITDLQAKTVSTRQKNVRSAVEAHLDVLDWFLAGSYNRDTMIAPLKEADVDIFVVLKAKYWSVTNHATVLDLVKGVLKKTYKTPDISRNGQAVTIRFDDFKVDVVPCFNRKDGGYLIPDSILKRWIPTDPTKHLDIWTEANAAHHEDFVPLLKMLKAWNRETDTMRSFHLETLALRVLTNITIDDFPSGVRYVFDKARELIPVKVADPAGYSDDVAAYVDTKDKIDEIVTALNLAHQRALDAESLAASGQIQAAFAKWRLIFGNYFPAYG